MHTYIVEVLRYKMMHTSYLWYIPQTFRIRNVIDIDPLAHIQTS